MECNRKCEQVTIWVWFLCPVCEECCMSSVFSIWNGLFLPFTGRSCGSIFTEGLKLDHFKPCVHNVSCGWFPLMIVSNINFVNQICKDYNWIVILWSDVVDRFSNHWSLAHTFPHEGSIAKTITTKLIGDNSLDLAHSRSTQHSVRRLTLSATQSTTTNK